MRKLISSIIALLIFTTAFSQVKKTTGGGTSSCDADCLFTSCRITCTNSSPGGGGAICTCAWGFASCACGQGTGSSAHTVSSNAYASENVEKLNELLNGFETESAKIAAELTVKMLSDIKAKDYEAYDKDVATYDKHMNELNEEQKKKVKELLASLTVSTEARKKGK